MLALSKVRVPSTRNRQFHMRTTLNIDDDALSAAEELARREGKSAGQFISGLIREALGQRVKDGSQRRRDRDFYGFIPIPAGGAVVTDELVNKLRDELGV